MPTLDELQARITELEAENADLRTTVADTEAEIAKLMAIPGHGKAINEVLVLRRKVKTLELKLSSLIEQPLPE
jgi:hypothetical protein